MTFTTESAKPELDERLATASNSSDLSIDGRNIGDALLLTAAGKAPKTLNYLIGRHLIALESEWDRAEQPRVPTAAQIEAMAKAMPAKVHVEILAPGGEKSSKEVPAIVAAKLEAERWYEAERMRLVARLKSFTPAHTALTLWATGRGMDSPESRARSVLVWWLDHRCPKCNGTKLAPVPLGGRGAVRVCSGQGGCSGTGERQLPNGADGRELERKLIECRHATMGKVRKFIADYRREM